MILRNVLVAGVVTAVALALGACGSTQSRPVEIPGPPAVVASTDVYGAVAGAVGGDLAQVQSIITDRDVNPSEYEHTPADLRAVTESRVVVLNGAGYDGYLVELVSSAPRGRDVIDVSLLSGLQEGLFGGGDFNQHLWYHLPTMAKLADRLASGYATADKANAAAYRANADAFKRQLDELNGRLEAIRAAHGGARVIATDTTAYYLMQAAGLANVTPEEFTDAVADGDTPSAEAVEQTVRLLRTNQAAALLVNTQTPGPAITRLTDAATAAGVPVVQVGETLPDGTTDYIAWMTAQVEALSAALSGP